MLESKQITMTNTLESNILLQLFFVVFCAAVFILIVEGFGRGTKLALSLLLKDRKTSETSSDSFAINVLIGSLVYCLLFFFIGLLGALYSETVIAISAAIPLFVFILDKRWRRLKRMPIIVGDNKYVILGSALLFLLTLPLWFRPITNFDALWYHLTIPKLFLQSHGIADQGEMIRYSLQPSLNYFLNLWPLSLPITTQLAGIIINTITACYVILSLALSSKLITKIWNIQKYYIPVIILILGSTYELLRMIGTGGNDLLGACYGLVAVLYCHWALKIKKSQLTWSEWVIGVLLIVGLASVKFFFSIFAALVLLYFVISSLEKFKTTNTTYFKIFLKQVAFLFIIFALTYLPWLIRSYVASGHILYPVGAPGFNEGVYWSEGGGTALNHWTQYVFDRFSTSVIPILIFVYSPLVLIGTLAIFNKDIREKSISLWLLAVTGLWVTFIASIALQWRYSLPPALVVITLGLVVAISFLKHLDVFGKIVLTSFAILLITLSLGRTVFSSQDRTGFPSVNGDLYISNYNGINNYIDSKLSHHVYDYVQQAQPADLKPNELIYLGNAGVEKNIPIYGMQKIAYVKNPFIEYTINPSVFKDVKTAEQLAYTLKSNGVRYMLSQGNPKEVCEFTKINKPETCENIFKKNFVDTKWKKTWYKLEN